MASLLNANLPSEDEEDDDYRPDQDKTADAGDRKEFSQQPAKAATRKRARPRGVAPTGPVDVQQQEEEEEEEAEEEDILASDDASNARVQAKRARTEQLWALLNSRPGEGGKEQPEASKAPVKGPSNTVSLAALCKTVDTQRVKDNTDAIWMRMLGISKAAQQGGKQENGQQQAVAAAAAASTSGAEASAGQQQQQGEPADNGVSAKVAAAAAALGLKLTKSNGTAGGSTTGAGAATTGPGSSSKPSGSAPVSEASRAAAAAALAAVGSAFGAASKHGKVTVTETRRFAGKDIQVTLQVDKDSKEAQRAAAAKAAGEAAAAPAAKSGLDAFLAEVDKKKKVNVLDKTRADWQQVKAANAEIEEELEAHKRSDKQYLEKVNFLKRAELREYEKERDQRLASDVRTRGRL